MWITRSKHVLDCVLLFDIYDGRGPVGDSSEYGGDQFEFYDDVGGVIRVSFCLVDGRRFLMMVAGLPKFLGQK